MAKVKLKIHNEKSNAHDCPLPAFPSPQEGQQLASLALFQSPGGLWKRSAAWTTASSKGFGFIGPRCSDKLKGRESLCKKIIPTTGKTTHCVLTFLTMSFNFLATRHVASWFPDQGLEPTSPALEAQSLNHWTMREVPSTMMVLTGGLFQTVPAAPFGLRDPSSSASSDRVQCPPAPPTPHLAPQVQRRELLWRTRGFIPQKHCCGSKNLRTVVLENHYYLKNRVVIDFCNQILNFKWKHWTGDQ